MKAEDFYKQRSNSIRELWALSPKQIEYIALIMEEYAALRQPPVIKSVCKHENATWNADAGCMVCDECNEKC